VTATGLGGSDFRRVAVIAGATAVVIIALLFPKSFYSVTTAPSGADVSQAAADRAPAAELASIVASPTIDTNPQLFFGCGDGSNGYYAEQPTLALVRYEQMP
jgi:hypothetical protein